MTCSRGLRQRKASCNQDPFTASRLGQQSGSCFSCTQQTVSDYLLPGEAVVYLTYSIYVQERWRRKSLIIGWENVGSAVVSCSSHLFKQELREAYTYCFLNVCFGLESVMPKSVMFWFWYVFVFTWCLSFSSFFVLLVSAFLEPFPSPRPAIFSIPSLLSLSLCFDFQGIPGEPGKRGKMGRPVKFCLNILYR